MDGGRTLETDVCPDKPKRDIMYGLSYIISDTVYLGVRFC